jgi:hypothetical protein
MTRKYLIRDYFDVFSEEFIGLVNSSDTHIPSQTLQHIMNRIEDYEKKNDVEFVNFFGQAYIIFKQEL